MTRKGSLSKRLFRTMLLIGIVNVVITLVATEFIYEDIEETSLTIGLADERAYFEQRLVGNEVTSWRSALLTAFFVPAGKEDVELPHMFRGKPVPYAAEVDLKDETYLLSIAPTEQVPGVLYLAQDITVLENREDSFQEFGFIMFAVGILAISLILARLGAARIIRPLQSLSSQIRKIRPDSSFKRIPAHYEDEELNEIAGVLNDLLKALDTYVRREKALVSLASHELRTPIAVISGALDVIDQRSPTDPTNRKTLDRIRQATDKMQADVDALLKLAHRSSEQDRTERVDLARCAHRVVAELESSAPEYVGRVKQTAPGDTAILSSDQTLVHMLMRNLIQNALRHTRDFVYIDIHGDRLSISDAGEGLPSHVRARLDGSADDKSVPEDGLGLFIVRLICERLAWTLQVRQSSHGGTHIDIVFRQEQNHPSVQPEQE